MPSTNVSFRVDTELKKSAEDLFRDLGLNMSSAINIFLRSAVNYNGIPFAVRRPILSAETSAALAEYENMKSDPDNYKRYDSFDDLANEVLADA